MRILFGFVLSLLVAGNAHAETATGYSRTEACKAATSLVEKAKQPTVKCSCYEWGEKIACKIVPLEQALIPEEEAPEISEQLVTRPAAKETPLFPPPAMDKQALVGELPKLQAPSCKELYQKRDGELAELMKRNFIHLEKSKEILSMLNALDEEMRAEKPKMMLEGIVLHILLRIKTIGQVSQDALGYAAPEASDAVNSFEALVINREDPKHFLRSFIEDKAADKAFPSLAAIKGIDHLISNLSDEKKSEQDRQATWRSVEDASKSLRDQINNLNQKMAAGEIDRFLINEAKNQIDAYCNAKTASGSGADGMSSPAPAVTTGPEPSMIDNAINWAKSLLRRKAACDPANADCKPAPRVSVGGIGG